MNCWERHGLGHLSFSNLNLYREEPAKWCLQYLYKVRDNAGPAAWRGSAVEAGLDWWLYQRNDPEAVQDALTKAHARFEEDAKGEIRDDIDKERDSLEPMLNRAIERMDTFPVPLARQLREEFWFDGIEIPVTLIIDYVWPDDVLDLKTTHRLEVRPAHEQQISLYAKAKKRRAKLLYVTTKRSELVEIPQEAIESNVRAIERVAHSVRALLSICPDKETAASMFAPNYDHYYHWKNADLRQAAEEIWT
jgi:hypothetical protein